MSELLKLSFEQAQAFMRMEDEHPEMRRLPDLAAKRAFVDNLRQDKMREIQQNEKELAVKRRQIKYLDDKQKAFQDMLFWEASGIAMERPDGPSFRALRRAVRDGNTLYASKDAFAEAPALDLEQEVFRHAEVVVIEHNWAHAFQGATEDVAKALVRLPFDVCAFEFKFSGCPVIALTTQVDTEILFTPAVNFGGLWFLFEHMVPLEGLEPTDERNSMAILLDEISTQVRAACIALDAEVATTTATREVFAGQARNVSRPPKPYHVVSLANRPRRAPALEGEGSAGRHVRLHFRRGHWRHFEDHKTWIKWMLVGDPDLGFVEKHYRL